MRTANWWIGVSLGVAAGLGGFALANGTTHRADAASVSVTPAQLKINQRISQAAVRRSNEALSLLSPVRKVGSTTPPGWGTAQIKDGAVTPAKLDTAARERLPRWAVVTATTGKLDRGQGATAAAKATDPGIYTVTFDRDVSACALTASAGDGGTTPLTTASVVSAWRSATDAKTVTVRTADAANAPINTLPFTVSVLC